MQKNSIEISIIIVHYEVKKELFACLASIYKSKPNVSFEIIVVDNDERKNIKVDLLKKFPLVGYIENENVGWGGGINRGLLNAKGKYIYLLNPDTVIIENAIDGVYDFMVSKPNIGIASSLLLDVGKNVYPLQGTRALTPLTAVFGLSAMNKFFPNNLVSRWFWMRDVKREAVLEVEVPTLSAALVKHSILKKIGGFDKNFFLYFEEYDLSRRIRKMGFRNYIIPTSRVIHIWEASTKKVEGTEKFMSKSRRYYFKKYYGEVIATMVEFLLELDRRKIAIIALLIFVIIVFGYTFSLQ